MTNRIARPLAAVLLALAAASCGARSAGADALLRPWPSRQATPALKLVDLDGRDWDLASLRGKVVLINFWAGWCGPCVDELPVLNELAARHKDALVVVGVNYKESRDAIERFKTAHPFAYPLLRDRSGEMFKQWTSGVMPATILVDRQGRARWRTAGEIGAGGGKLGQAIEELSNEKGSTR